jgi:hypothetical protein
MNTMKKAAFQSAKVSCSRVTPNPSVKGTCLRQAPYVER